MENKQKKNVCIVSTYVVSFQWKYCNHQDKINILILTWLIFINTWIFHEKTTKWCILKSLI